MESRTPIQQYQVTKESFIAKYSDQKAWGNQICTIRLGAIDDVVDFIVKTELKLELNEEHRARIQAENVARENDIVA